MERQKTITVALAGQPNTGKSTVFNMLTGLNQHVGNWPGKTVERKIGTATYKGTTYRLVDLPGTYSLTANSLEEMIARDFIIEEQPDVVVVVTDAAHLERNLYLVTELLPLSVPVIIALNMMDVAEQEGRPVDPRALEEATGIRVVPMVAAKNQGVKELLPVIHDLVHAGVEYAPGKPEVREDHYALLDEVQTQIAGSCPAPYPEDWVALKLLEGDGVVTEMMKESLDPARWARVEGLLREHDDAQLAVASGRYEWIERVTRSAVTRPKAGVITRTRRFDRIATHPVWGLLLAIGSILATFIVALVVSVVPMMGVVHVGNPMLGSLARTLLAGGPAWLRSMVADGLIPGMGTVIGMTSFLVPILLAIGFLEDVGYMARVAYVADRFMHRLGLHGRSFMPLFMGFTCNIAGVMGTRVVDSWRERMITVFLAPIIPCLAIWVVAGFITTLFFGPSAPLVIVAMLAAVVVQLFVTAFLLNHTVLKGEHTGFIMELPLYHRPNWRTIWTYVWNSIKVFLRRGATVIPAVALLIWILSYLPYGDIETSLLASLGRALTPIGNLMGMDWRLLISLVASFVSKEAAIATMAVIYGVADASAGATSLTGVNVDAMRGAVVFEHSALGNAMLQSVSPASALAFLFATLFFLPCAGTTGALFTETRSFKWGLGVVVYYLASSLMAGTIAYQIGRLIFGG